MELKVLRFHRLQGINRYAKPGNFCHEVKMNRLVHTTHEGECWKHDMLRLQKYTQKQLNLRILSAS
jgi:hypothetical protein